MRSHLTVALFVTGVFVAAPTVNTFAQSSYLLVSSRNTFSIKRYNGDTGAYIDDFVNVRSGGLLSPQEVLWLNGSLLVTGRGNKQILEYDGQTGNFIGAFSTGYDLDEPTKMTLGPDSMLYVSQWGQNKSKVVRFRAQNGAFVDEFTSIGLNQGCGHAWDGDGNLYVAGFGSADVKKFDIRGQFVTVFSEPGHLRGPVNLWFGEDGDLFVVDWALGSVLEFDGTDGAFKSTFISGLQNAEGFAFGPDSTLYLCDWTLNRVNRYDRAGQLLGVFAQGGGLITPNSLAFVASGPTSVVTDREVPRSFLLHQNYPNPFNPETRIVYELAARSEIVLEVLNLIGRRVRTLVAGEVSAGRHELVWDGRNDSGAHAASGIYLLRLVSEGRRISRKMILIR